MTNEEVGEINWTLNVGHPEPPPRRGGRSTTILVVRDVVNRFLSPENAQLVGLVVNDFGDRDDMGFEKHGQNLEANDGRFTEKDAYEELLDAAQYYKKLTLEEPESKHAERMYDRTVMLVMDARLGLMNKEAMTEAMDWRKPDENAQTGSVGNIEANRTDAPTRHREVLRKGE
jgi:hypothetical protein